MSLIVNNPLLCQQYPTQFYRVRVIECFFCRYRSHGFVNAGLVYFIIRSYNIFYFVAVFASEGLAYRVEFESWGF